jgi:hypothetical protein
MKLLKPLQAEMAPADDRAPVIHYAYKASLIGSAHQFELTDEGLSWHIGSKAGIWPYSEIRAIRLSYRPISMQSRRYRADIENANRQRIAVISTTWQTVALMAPQDSEYRTFITRLHGCLQEAGSKVALIGGLGSKRYAAGIVLLALVGIAIAALLVRAIATGEFSGALFLVGFAILFGWQVGGFVLRNKPQSYSFDELPQELLPRVQKK